jgi:hypothetical protein
MAAEGRAAKAAAAATTGNGAVNNGGAAIEFNVTAIETSQPFVGRWDRLVSSTNWEKGRIIHEWREALVVADAPVQEYSDEAWSKLVGNVTPQHVGRLRRTFQRFFQGYESYAGLYWSHFHAALDWNDAELWLEGAAQNGWSVSAMRRERWEKLGAVAADEPRADEIVTAEVDEDVDPNTTASGKTTEVRDPREFDGEGSNGPRYDEPDFGDEGPDAALENGEPHAEEPPFETEPASRPFENLAALPADLHEAFESFKLAILHHKLKEWSEVAVTDVVAALRALETLATTAS